MIHVVEEKLSWLRAIFQGSEPSFKAQSLLNKDLRVSEKSIPVVVSIFLIVGEFPWKYKQRKTDVLPEISAASCTYYYL